MQNSPENKSRPDEDHGRDGMSEGWDSGIRIGKQKQLSSTAVVETNLLGVPLFALHSRSATSNRAISTQWRVDGVDVSFVFSRVGDEPFPLPTHAKILDCLIAHFANNFSSDGVLKFKMSDISRDCGKASGAREAIKEAVKRYQHTHASWQLSFVGRTDTWSGPIILYSSLTNPKDKGRNPRNGFVKDSWHELAFHPVIVNSIKEKQIRVIQTEALKNMPADVYIVYRWLKRFTDKEPLRRRLSTAQESLNCRLRPNLFAEWFKGKLRNLETSGYITSFEVNDQWFQVKLSTLKSQKLELIRQNSNLEPLSPDRLI